MYAFFQSFFHFTFRSISDKPPSVDRILAKTYGMLSYFSIKTAFHFTSSPLHNVGFRNKRYVTNIVQSQDFDVVQEEQRNDLCNAISMTELLGFYSFHIKKERTDRRVSQNLLARIVFHRIEPQICQYPFIQQGVVRAK